MLDQHDLQQIGSIVDSAVSRAIERSVKPMISDAINSLVVDILKPSFDEVYLRLDRVEQRLDAHDMRFQKIESQMVTKSYLDDKLADLRADLMGIDRKQEQKVDILADELCQQRTITPTFRKHLRRYDAFRRKFP